MTSNRADELLHHIDDSHVPLGEEEETLSSIRRKLHRREKLTREEEKFLQTLAMKADEWKNAVKSSSDTEPEDTLAG